MKNASEEYESAMNMVLGIKGQGIIHPRDADNYLYNIRIAHRLFIEKLRVQSRPTQDDIAASTFLRREYRLYSEKLANAM
jgi:hypothetical protein